jgi:hypothetical protein
VRIEARHPDLHQDLGGGAQNGAREDQQHGSAPGSQDFGLRQLGGNGGTQAGLGNLKQNSKLSAKMNICGSR